MISKLLHSSFAMLALACCASAGQLSFNVVPRDIPIGKGAKAVVAGDFNRDGINDLAVSASGAVYVLIGQGNGKFASPVSYSAKGLQPWSIVTADFNRDGNLDLAVGEASQVDVFLGKGDGTFALAASQPSLTSAYNVATADFNRDGKPDLAVTDSQSSVHVLLGNGDGTFSTGSTLAAGSQPLGIAAADLNNDHIPDLIVGDYSGVSVLFGQSNGGFAAAVYYSLSANGSIQVEPTVGDLNGDGYPDIVIGGTDNLVALFGSSNGKFTGPVTIAPASGYYTAIQDFNGDGKLDLAETVNNTLQIYLGKGDGTFTAGQTLGTGEGPYWVIAPRLNVDRAPDLVSVNLLTANLSVFLGHGNGTFGQPILPLGSGASGATGVTAGDVNHDGISDLIASNSSGSISVFLGTGGGKFGPAAVFQTGPDPQSIAVADFNQDGNLDVVTANYEIGSVSVLFGNGDGTFQAHQDTLIGPDLQSVVIGDMNSDGIPDIVATSVESEIYTTLISNGDGTFKNPVSFLFFNGYAGATQIVLADFNGDGKLDVAGEYFYGSGLQVLNGNGDGSFSLGSCVCGPPYPSGLAVGDFNKDGLPDVAYALYDENLIGVSLNAAGKLQQPVTSAAASAPSLLAVGDFDGDGNLDIVSSGLSSNILNFSLGKGDGTFQNGPKFPTYAPTLQIGGNLAVAVDLNGDGKLDLAVAEPQGVQVLLNTTK